jgi:hypothetical protein
MRIQLAGSLLRTMFSRSVTSAMQAEVSFPNLRLPSFVTTPKSEDMWMVRRPIGLHSVGACRVSRLQMAGAAGHGQPVACDATLIVSTVHSCLHSEAGIV